MSKTVKCGSNVRSKATSNFLGHVVSYQPLNNYALVARIVEYKLITKEYKLSDLEVA
tara:strand:+ start:1069 stop:1239 length:171 start_codon:yes stop_codon:yes gene_type:complete